MGKTLLFVCLLMSSAQLFANKGLLPPPTTPASNIIITRDGNALHFSWTNGDGARRILVMRQGAAVTGVPVNGVDYTHNANFGSGDVLNAGEFIVSDGNVNTASIFNLTPGSTYHVAIFEYNGTGAATEYLLTGAVANGTTYSSAPTVQASNVTFSNVTTTSMVVSWTGGNGSGALVVMRANSAVNGSPVDLTFYLARSNFGSGTQVGAGNFAVYQTLPGLLNTVTVTNLGPGNTYHVAVFECNGAFGPFYNTVNPARGSQAMISTPTVPASNISFSNVYGGSMRMGWTNGNGSRRIVVASAGSPVTAVPVDGNDYSFDNNFELAPELAPGQKIIFNGTSPIMDVINLQPATTYHFRIYEFFGSGASTTYLTSSFASGSQATISPPTVQSSNIVISDVTSTTFRMNWTRGNGNECIVLVKSGEAVDSDPVNLFTYFPSANFGEGDGVGNSNFVVFRGTGNSVQVFGLQPGETYHVAVYELNSAGIPSTQPVYNTVNPARANLTTLGRPTVSGVFGVFNQINSNSMQANWTRGNGQRRIIVANAGSPVTAVPSDGVIYAANTDFTQAQEISTGQRVVYDGTDITAFITGLQPSTTYHYRLYEYNVSAGVAQYLTTAFGQGNATTFATPVNPVDFTFSNLTANSADISWTGGSGTGSIVLAREGGAVNVEPVDFTAYTPNSNFGFGDQIGSGNFVVFVGSTNAGTVANLQPGRTYHFALYEMNGTTSPIYQRPGISASVTIPGPPLIPPATIIVSQVNSDAITISWTNGDGNGRLVLFSQGAPVSSAPVNNTEYTASPVFGGGSELRTTAGNFVVYNGTGNTVTVTNLSARTTYHFAIYEYNRFGPGNIQYLTSSFASSNATTSSPLPVTWLSFTAELKNDKAILDWSTAQETNSSHFVIEKSSDGIQFASAGTVQAAGNSFNPVNYQYTDNDPIDGISYYRLKQVDLDGNFSYSRTLTIQYEAKSAVKKIINPFSNSVFVQFTAGTVAPGTPWKLYDMQGRLVLTRVTQSNIINEPAAILKPGIYLFEIMIRGKRQVIKLVRTE
jgi:hypothetical protein